MPIAETGERDDECEHPLAAAPVFIDVQRQVASIIKDKILVGYALWEFLSVMNLAHPAINTRDTALFMSFRRTLNQKPNAIIPLQTLVKHFMGRDIGQNGDVPVERARAALDLFRSCEQTWEGIIATGAWPCALPPADYRNFFT
ncbi:RNA exonuclease 4 [Trametes pubescens]|uniref:RNA exonuclease 4 n=1 Tax=Trametes pubescens TaxID=154538 RepID=A0A1M2W8C9_TRAPU|nr:RNA exonuclease 4 [Trametes pubescens]